jgi:hypothetical protein
LVKVMEIEKEMHKYLLHDIGKESTKDVRVMERFKVRNKQCEMGVGLLKSRLERRPKRRSVDLVQEGTWLR